jgi:hypothetical protein
VAAQNQVPKLQFPTMDPVFQQHYQQMIDTVNYLAGHNGVVTLANHLDLNGNRVMNVGEPVDPTDALPSGVAEESYSAQALRPQLESTGSTPLKTMRQINNNSQREISSSYLNSLMSTAPRSNTINPIFSGSSNVVTIPASKFQFADGSSVSYPSRTDTLPLPASYSITSWSVTSGVATVNLGSTPSPPLVVGGYVGITGTSGAIDGIQQITNIISPTEFQFNTTGTGSGVTGNVAVGGTYYYYVQLGVPRIQLVAVPTGVDTPFQRLSVSGDNKQLVAVLQTGSGGVVSIGTAGGGTPTNTANAGSTF